MTSKLPLIGRLLGIVLGLIGVVLFVMVALDEESAPGFVSFGLIATIVGVVVAVLSSVLSLAINPKGIRGVGIGLVALLVVGGISYVMADGSDYMNYKDVTEQTSMVVSAMLNAFYFVFAGAVLAVVYSLVYRVIK